MITMSMGRQAPQQLENEKRMQGAAQKNKGPEIACGEQIADAKKHS